MTTDKYRSLRGVTLIELVVVMALLGIIAVVAAVALRDPVRAYADTNRRADLTDMADTALRRMGRDIRRALPNSPRVMTAGTNQYLELLLTRTGGRYRAQGPAGDPLDFNLADNSLDSLGALSVAAGQAIVPNSDFLVVHNLFATGSTQANAYTFGQAACAAPTSVTCNSALITGTNAVANGTHITFAARRFPLSSPGNRFHVVEGPVTYACENVGLAGTVPNQNGTGILRRVAGYAINIAQPTPAGGSLLAQNVSACDIVYNPLVLAQSLGLVALRLQITRSGETVTLYHEIHVSNVP